MREVITDSAPNADERFVNYYAKQSESPETGRRIASVVDLLLRIRSERGLPTTSLDVVDVGCGAGSQALVWARDGHRVTGVDVSAPLIELARKRAADEFPSAKFYIGSASKLPFDDSSSDVVLVSELLEHIASWEPCVNESLRILRPGGVLYISTTNRLCPIQQEFELPLYGWYPTALKKYCERLAMTSHPHWVQYASFPAVNWFSFYQLRNYLNARGFSARDRFDVMDTKGSFLRKAVLGATRRAPLLRALGHILTPYTVVVGVKLALKP